MADDDPLQLARDLARAPALARDPRPGTRELAVTTLGALGIELLRCDAHAVVARIELTRPETSRALLLVLAETAASTAAGLHAGEHRRAFGAELNASWPATPAPGQVVAAATPLALGEQLQVWRIVASDVHGTQVLESRCTLGVVDLRP